MNSAPRSLPNVCDICSDCLYDQVAMEILECPFPFLSPQSFSQKDKHRTVLLLTFVPGDGIYVPVRFGGAKIWSPASHYCMC